MSQHHPTAATNQPNPTTPERRQATRRPLRIALACFFLATSLAGAAVSDEGTGDFAKDLRNALKLHEDSASFDEQNGALKAFRQVTTDHPEEWLGHFWAAYEETQIARLIGMQQGESEGPISGYLDRAQSHLDTCSRLASAVSGPSGASDRDRSSIAALQSLIFQFKARGATESGAAEWQNRATIALANAIEIDRSNPVVLVFAGTSLIRLAEKESSLDASLAAVTLLREAKTTTASIDDRSTTTQFNAEWLPFWLPRAEKSLEAQISSLNGSDG